MEDTPHDEPDTPNPATLALTGVLDELLSDQMETNRRTARRAAGIVEIFELARQHPEVYTELEGIHGVRAAEIAVMLDVSMRLHLPEGHIRTLAWHAQTATAHLPLLWRRALEGFAAFTLVEATVTGIMRLQPAVNATDAESDAARAAIALVDDLTSEWVLTLTAAAFRRRLRILIDRLDPRGASTRHTAALAERRVLVDDAGDGMSWFMALIPTIDALAAKRRLTSTAKHVQKTERDGRDRDQIRADLASAWLRGVGTPTAVKTKVFVTIPVGLLAGTFATDDGHCTTCGGTGFAEQAQVIGGDLIDPVTAKQLFLDAKAFRRVVTDPIRKVIVDMDRRTYRATGAQRDWLILQHGTCNRDGCTRLAADCDLDHIRPWAEGGTTDLTQLRPLCPADHRRRHTTRIRYHTRDNGTVHITTPTGYTSDEPPPF